MTDALTDGQVRDWVRQDGDDHVFGHERFAFLATELLALRLKNERLRAALVSLTHVANWKSADKDNMEFEGRVTCYQLDQARAALKDALQ